MKEKINKEIEENIVNSEKGNENDKQKKEKKRKGVGLLVCWGGKGIVLIVMEE